MNRIVERKTLTIEKQAVKGGYWSIHQVWQVEYEGGRVDRFETIAYVDEKGRLVQPNNKTSACKGQKLGSFGDRK